MKQIYEELLANIPDYKVFLTVEELDENSRKLAEKYPDVAEVFEIGHTKDGYPLQCLRVGSGSHVGLMFGCPHPNEPIGTMMLEYFTEQLAANKELRDALDYTWYVVKAWDADGLKLNEKWLKGPYTIYNYSRNFFRPAGQKQVDWTFPIDYKELHFHDVTPEAEAMMGLIDRIRPEFIYSLHNAGFGGVYWYIMEGDEPLFEKLREVADRVGVPLNLGEPETPSCVELSPAVYELLTIRDDYDYIEKYTTMENIASVIPCGTSSADYAKELCGSFTFLTELPYFYDPRVGDDNPSDTIRKEAVLQNILWTEEANKELREIIDMSREYLDDEDPFLLAVEAFSADDMGEATKVAIETEERYARLATEAEKFDSLLCSRFYKLLQYGMMVRANESALAAMDQAGEENEPKRAALTAAFKRAEAAHRKLSDELEEAMDYEVVPIRKLVEIQLGCGLLVVEYLKDKQKVN